MESHPFEKAGFFSKITFHWAKRFVDNPKETIGLPSSLDPEPYYKLLAQNWELEKQKAKPNLLRAMFRTYGKVLVLKQSPFLLDIFAQIALGILLGFFIDFLQQEDSEDRLGVGYAYALSIFFCVVLAVLVRHISFHNGHMLGGVLKQTLYMLVHDKIMNLSHEVIHDGSATGKVTNIASIDIEPFELVPLLNFLWLSPIAAVAISIVLLIKIGPSGLFGVFIISLLVPIQIKVNRLTIKLHANMAKMGDTRTKRTSEIMEGIRVLKMYGWETEYANKVFEYREKEVKYNRYRLLIRASNMSLFLVAQGLACLATFAGHMAIYGEIDTSTIFSTLSLFITAQFYLTIIFPVAVEFISKFSAAAKRIQSFMEEKEHHPVHKPYKEGCIKLDGVEASWKNSEEKASNTASESNSLVKNEEEFCLRDICMKIRKGDLCFVTGRVGSGKTSLLLTILGEMHISKGDIYRSGKIAYVEQEPWIVSGTIKQNITLGKHFDPAKYEEALRCSALIEDLQRMPKGDQTVIGEKGVNVSGGQKARLALARAIYADADIYMLDDPLSAVDVRIGRHIFDNTIMGCLANKTRILVTHQTQFINGSAKVYKVADGTVDKVSEAEQLEINEAAPHVEDEGGEGEGFAKETVEEDLESVKWSTYWKYIVKGWWWIIPINIILYPVTMLIYMGVPFWLVYWSEQSEEEQQDFYYIQVLALIVGVLFVLGFVRNNLFIQSLQSSSKNIHNEALIRMTRMPTRYFDENTSGKIMGRLSNDVARMDEFLTWFFVDMMQVGFITLGSAIAMLAGNPFMIAGFIPMVIGLKLIHKKSSYATQVHYKRFNASKSPILTHMNTTLSGLFALRSYNLLNDLRKVFIDTCSYNTNSFFEYHGAMRWMHFANDALSTAFISLMILSSVILINYLDKALLATGLSMLLILFVNLVWLMTQITQVQTFMASGERMLDYLGSPIEKELATQHSLSVKGGQVEFENVVLKYNEDITALNGVSFKVLPGEKIGIVGRTGAGKSTIIQALFRMVELSSGKIYIDETDISVLGLHTLRKAIAVIPQSPFIFTSSIRYNLDPFNEKTDAEIWEALSLASLGEKVSSMKEKLNEELNSNSFSVGEKQLLCLARALLKKSKVLVMDEATANVDYETDQIIQNSIRDKFVQSSVIVIAHRLDTIRNSDRIIVMQEGKVKEIGPPEELLSNQDSAFAQMIAISDKNSKKGD